MTELLEQAIDAVKRLPAQRQDDVALAMLALASNDGALLPDFEPPGGAPSEDEILALMPTVMPSAVPTKAEVEAWNRLPPGERLARLRTELSHPDCDVVTDSTMDDVLADARRLAAQRSDG